jgi:hypothetical protein
VERGARRRGIFHAILEIRIGAFSHRFLLFPLV